MEILYKLAGRTRFVDSNIAKVAVKNGIAYATDLEVMIMTATDLKNGLYIEGIKIDDDISPYPFDAMKEKISERDLINNYPLKTSDLLDYLQFLKTSISKDNTRYCLCGICLRKNDMVATDGHVLKRVQLNNIDFGEGAIVPSDTVDYIIGALKKYKKEDPYVNITLFKTAILFKIGEYSIISRLIDGNYPDYNKVIPKTDNYYRIEFDPKPFKDGLKVIKKLKKAYGIKERDKDFEVVIEDTQVKWLKDIAHTVCILEQPFPIKYGFNCKYLSDMEKGTIFLSNNNSDPAVIKSGDNLTAVIMPVKIG